MYLRSGQYYGDAKFERYLLRMIKMYPTLETEQECMENLRRLFADILQEQDFFRRNIIIRECILSDLPVLKKDPRLRLDVVRLIKRAERMLLNAA